MSRTVYATFVPVVAAPKVTAQSLIDRLDKAIAAADRGIDKVRDIAAARRDAERAAFARDYSAGPWASEPAAALLRDTSDFVEMPLSKWDLPRDEGPAEDYSPVPVSKWG